LRIRAARLRQWAMISSAVMENRASTVASVSSHWTAST
jgi:hypothetical protein